MTNSKDNTAPGLVWRPRSKISKLVLAYVLSSRLEYQRRDRVRWRSEGTMARLNADGSDLRVIERPVHSSYSLAGVVRFLSSVSTTKTASSFAGWVLLALRLIG
jgi:hypothetical protein